MSVVFNVAQTLVKFAYGRPHGHSLAVGFLNAAAAFRYFAGRRFGSNSGATFRLGYGGRLHTWKIERREDLTVLEEVFLDEDYGMCVSSPSVVFDLGANFGAAAVYFALRWPDARVFAVEPNPEMYQRLCDTTAGYRNIRCLSCAVGARDGKLPFKLSKSSVASGFFGESHDTIAIEVEVRSLRTLMAICGVENVDLLKFDIEGAETLLLTDPSAMGRVDAFVGEIHPDLMPNSVESMFASLTAFETRRSPLLDGRFLLRGRRPRK